MTPSLGRRSGVVVALAISSVIVPSLSWQRAVARNLFTRPAMAQGTAVLSGHTPRPVLDGTAKLVERYDPNQMLRLAVGLQPPHMAEEEQFLHDLQTKGSPEFHHFLTAEEWNARFSPAAQDEQAVVDWAEGQGLTVTQRFPNRLLVDVEAPMGTIEKALSVTMNSYQLGVRTFFSNDREPTIPASLAGIVHSVLGLNNLQVRHHRAGRGSAEPAGPIYVPGPAVTRGRSVHADRDPHADGDPTKLNTPVDMAGAGPSVLYSSNMYDYSALYALGHCCNPFHDPNGSPPYASIAVYASGGDVADADIQGFQHDHPYLAYNYDVIYVDGSPPFVCHDSLGPDSCSEEATMDIEWAAATANSFGSYLNTAHIYVYDEPDSSPLADVWNHMLNDGYARVLSVSIGFPEAECFLGGTLCVPLLDLELVAFNDHAIFDQMVGEGWTLVAGSGDGGATDACSISGSTPMLGVDYPASDPDVVAAGGTSLLLDEFSGAFQSETGWTGGTTAGSCATNNGGSGGGCSNHWPAPAYQTNSPCGPFRSVPDLALNAAGGSQGSFFFGGKELGGGGTSIVAPELAGFFAQENAYLGSLGSPNSVGNANYAIYDEGINGSAPHYPFYDVTRGCNSNDQTATVGFYCAVPGYDQVTGWGSANMLQLAWAINNFIVGDGGAPAVTFSGPPPNPRTLSPQWYNTNQTVSWTVTDTSQNSYPPNGVAGFSQAWDGDIGDVYATGTPGADVNAFYHGPQFPNAVSGCLQLTPGGPCAGGVSDGCHTAYVRSWDNAGESSDQAFGPVCYDTTPPVTSVASFAPSPNAAGWFNSYSGVWAQLQAVDPGADSGAGSGVFTTYAAVDEPACTPRLLAACPANAGAGIWSAGSEGFHVLYFFSEDNAGNFEVQKSAAVNVDHTPPHTTASLSGIQSGGVYVSPVQVTLTATDNLSGVANSFYQVDLQGVQTYTGPFTPVMSLPVGRHTLSFYSVDNAGNMEDSSSIVLELAEVLGPPCGGQSSAGLCAVSYGCTTPSFGALAGPILSMGSASHPGSIAVDDFNNDGQADLAVANELGNTVSILLGTGTGGFTAAPESPIAVGSTPVFVTTGNFNNDLKRDLAVSNELSDTVSILLGTGAGDFHLAPGPPITVGSNPVSVGVGNFNGDGEQDLAVANSGDGTVSILLGNGDGTFTHTSYFVRLYGSPMSVAVGDFNGDGQPDLAVANSSYGEVMVRLGNGDGTFSGKGIPAHQFPCSDDCPVGSSTAKPVSVAVGDFNGDGIHDLAVANSGNGTVYILLGDGDGTFDTPSFEVYSDGIAVGSDPVSVAVGDFNRDGQQDLAVANFEDGTASVLLGKGDGSFYPPTNFNVGKGPASVAVGDFNGDGYPDLAIANEESDTVSILLTSPTQCVSGTVPSGGTLLAGTSTGAIQPVQTTVTSPVAATVSVIETAAPSNGPPGFSMLGEQVTISVTPTTAATPTAQNPLMLVFTIDASLIPAGFDPATTPIQVFKDGVLVQPCAGATGIASPETCVVEPEVVLSGGDVQITVLTSTASVWSFGVASFDVSCYSCTLSDCTPLAAGTNCNDGVFCNGTDTCNGAGQCSIHSGNPCPGTPCNSACQEGTKSCFDPVDWPCDDGNACTQNDGCNGLGQCVGAPVTAGTSCDDGVFCNGTDTCNGTGQCVHSGDPCPNTQCNSACQEGTKSCFDPVDWPCDDGNACTQNDGCNGLGQCVGTPVTNGTTCSAGNACTAPDACLAGVCVPAQCVSGPVGTGGTVTTGSTTSSTQPLQTSVTSPAAGTVAITETVSSGTSLSGFTVLGAQVTISAPAATPAAPLILIFQIDPLLLPPGANQNTIQLFKDGVLVPACTGSSGVASPDPCVSDRQLLTRGDVQITVLTSTASVWTFAVPSVCPNGCDDGNPCTVDSCDPAAGCRHSPTCLNDLVPGGGPLRTDCTQEWLTSPVPPPGPNGLPTNRLECTDDDPSCDFGASTGDQACTFHISMCLNVTEQRFACTPTDIQVVQILQPDPGRGRAGTTDTANRTALETALGQVGGHVQGVCIRPVIHRGQFCTAAGDCNSAPGADDGACLSLVNFSPALAATNICTGYASITVPVRHTASGNLAGTKRLRITAAPSLSSPPTLRDTDSLTLVCHPHP